MEWPKKYVCMCVCVCVCMRADHQTLMRMWGRVDVHPLEKGDNHSGKPLTSTEVKLSSACGGRPTNEELVNE